MTFAFPSLLWLGIPFLAGVLAIHLLNLRRQKPIQWAAMEFLLESERINKAWINLRQWLLLAVRMLVIAAAVFALAKPQLKKFTLAALADSRVSHIVILDDSYSMSDEHGAGSVWGDAVAAVDRVLEFAASHPQHQVTLLRASHAGPDEALLGEGEQDIGRLRALLADWRPSQQPAALAPAMAGAVQLTEAAPTGARRIVYVVTDGRRSEVEPLNDSAQRVERLQEAGAEVRWVACAATHSPNLTLSSLEPLPGPLAAGVELRMRVRVTNHGPGTATDVLVQVARDGRSSPAIEIGAIEAGQTAERQFSVLFRDPGPHRVTARLDADAVVEDNARYCSVDLAPERKVLLVDGSPEGREGVPYAAALRPNPRINTGWQPEVVAAEKISGATAFGQYAAVFLLDVPRLSDTTAAALVEYVRGGGGLFMSLGENADRDFYNQQLLGDRPQAIAKVELLKQGRPPLGEGGDMTVTEHPVFGVFSGDRNTFLSLVAVNYLHNCSPVDIGGRARVIASHTSGAPLVVESQLGEGRAVVMLTAAGQKQRQDESWSNLSTLPVFPVLALELAAHLAEPRLSPDPLEVGGTWNLPTGGDSGGPRVRISRVERGVAELVTEASHDEFATRGGPTAAGYYRIEPAGRSADEIVVVAANVDPAEGDLRLPADGELADALGRVGVSVETAVALSASSGEDGPSPIPPLLALLVVGLLLGEQALGVAASYHQESRGGAA
ncbi:hypothetical protein KOR34_04610 [Posidoniimonas corsicana]|uniref:VWFA domain-containing protein n=1 Tax=Posidoniimonas corsicana TaxID=1938618 RepID=A0A5C5VAI9_9BACT|nr:BatA domain-containing protein [Posidoniimonas corsicana]TWT35568.1 hypothetical protein KOR34_04610 [Posidoniimonas corsicana]